MDIFYLPLLQVGPIQGSLSTLRGILALARTSFQSTVAPITDVTSHEGYAIYHAVVEFFSNRLSSADMELVKGLLRSTLPEIQLSKSHGESCDLYGESHGESQGLSGESHEELREAIKMQLGERHLQQLPELIEKVWPSD